MFKGPKEVIIKKVQNVGPMGLVSYPRSTERMVAALSLHGYVTGLTEQEEKYYEKELGLKEGELNCHNDKFWGEIFNVKYAPNLNKTKPTRLILDSPVAQLQYKVLLASHRVAKSEIEKNKAGIDFYIVDEETTAKLENEVFDAELEAMELLATLKPEEKRASLRLFGRKGIEDLSESVVKSELRKEMKKDPKLFLSILQDKSLKTKMFLEELIEYRIIGRKGNYFTNGDDTIASSTDECVEYLEDVKNQSVVLAMGTKLKKLKKG